MPRMLASAALLLLLWGSPASATEPETRIHGPYCPPAGCEPSRGSSLATGAGFASAALATLWIGRRRERA